jgi:hypothetical protein
VTREYDCEEVRDLEKLPNKGYEKAKAGTGWECLMGIVFSRPYSIGLPMTLRNRSDKENILERSTGL